VLALTLPVAACDSSSPSVPSQGAIVTFRVSDETFRVWLETPKQISAARAAQSGARASIPNGRIVSGTQVNTGWSWHLVDVTFAELAIEVCDGRPSDVEREGVQFGAGRYCPWSAIVVRVDER
jgi:hypothetical protein